MKDMDGKDWVARNGGGGHEFTGVPREAACKQVLQIKGPDLNPGPFAFHTSGNK